MTERQRDLAALTLFIVLAVLYVRPLFDDLFGRIAVDAGDPALNAAVLWWNATSVPFMASWWNQPWFHPATGVTAFTENLTGLWPVATPAWWITRNPVATYNLTFFATWPLSAFGAYFLALRLTGRRDAGIVAGLAFAFSPYRASAALGHLQSLSAFWLPVALGALHAYLEHPRPRWLVLFGAGWLLQSLANGYYMLFGGVLIALWLAYFGTLPRTRRAAVRIVVTWIVASVPLLPILLQYQQIHSQYGLRRSLDEAMAFSARVESWFQVADHVRLWGPVLPVGREMLFPGITAALVVAVAVVIGLSRTRSGAAPSARRALVQIVLTIISIACAAALTAFLVIGQWSIRRGGTVFFRMSEPERAVALLALCVIPLIWLAPVRDRIASRRPLAFYVIATLVMALLACGPVLTAGERVLLDPSPYRWLMALPGFDGLRVPSRFWMMGMLCLSTAAGVAYASITRRAGWPRYLACAAIATGVMADGWLRGMPTAPAPPLWTHAGDSDARLPLLELPLGPGWDSAATLRTTAHGRRVMNGVSGYDPPHYGPLKAGLRVRDPEMLAAIATLGAYEVSIEASNDRDGEWRRYVAGAPGSSLVADDGTRAIFRIVGSSRGEPTLGPSYAVASIRANEGNPALALDDRLDTQWADGRQTAEEWLVVDLGRILPIGGVSLAIGEHPMGFPSRLAIEVSADGTEFQPVWQGNGAAPTFLAVVRQPRTAWLRLAVPSHDARFVRIRQIAWDARPWIVSEIEVHAPRAAGALALSRQ